MLTPIQLEVLNGALLGDGCLIIHKNGKNATFNYLSSEKEHVEYIFSFFKNFCNYTTIKFGSYLDKRTNKAYTRYWFRTKALPVFTLLYYKWYPNNIKVIPPDIKLSPLTTMIWYVGDGSIGNSATGNNMVKLSTNGFTFDDVISITKQLKTYNAKIYKNDNKPIILIPRNMVKQFIDYIGECPVVAYKYKWDVTPYRYVPYEKGVSKVSTSQIAQFLELYASGVSYYNIAKKFGINSKRVQYYLKKHNVYISKRDILKPQLSAEDIQKVKELRDNNVRWAEIEKIFNISRFNLFHYIKKLKE